MQSIFEQMPNPSALEGSISPLLSSLGALITKSQGFSPSQLSTVLDNGKALSIPDGPAMIQATLSKLGRISEVLPSDPKALTAALSDGLQSISGELSGLSSLLKPLTEITAFIAPLLDKFTLLTSAVEWVNTIVGDLPTKASDLNLSSMGDVFALVSRLFALFPEAATFSPFKELKTQFDSIRVWMSSTSSDLSILFSDQITTLAAALPARLDAAMQASVDVVAGIEGSLAPLARSIWYEPFTAALEATASLDLTDFSRIDEYVTLIGGHATTLTEMVATLSGAATDASNLLDSFDAAAVCHELSDAFLDIVFVIAPESSGILAGVFHKVEAVIAGLNFADLAESLKKVDAKVDELLGSLEISQTISTIEETTDRIVAAVDTVNQSLVKVATTLSNAVAQLKELIDGIGLSELADAVKKAFKGLSDAVSGLCGQVTSCSDEVAGFVKGIGDDVKALDFTAVAHLIEDLLSQITSVLEDPQVKQILDEAEKGIAEMTKNLEGVTLKPVIDQVVKETLDLKTKLASVDLSQLNALLKAALMAALEVIKTIDFAQQVAGALKGDMGTILGNSSALIKPLQDKFLEIAKQVEAFNPRAIVADRLKRPFESLMTELKKIKPDLIFAPLKDFSDSLALQVERLRPDQFIAPLTAAHTKGKKALKSLSPHELIAPLNVHLAEATSLLDRIGIEQLIHSVTDSLTKLNEILGRFVLGDALKAGGFWQQISQLQLRANDTLKAIQAQLDQALDQLVAAIPDIDMTKLSPALVGMQTAINIVKAHLTAPASLASFAQAQAGFAAIEFDAGVTALTQVWTAQKKRLAEVSPPPSSAAAFEILKKRVNDLSPIVLLAAPSAQMDRIKSSLASRSADFTRGAAALNRTLTEYQPALDSLLPSEFTTASFKKLLRQTLDEQITKPARDFLAVIQQRVDQITSLLEKARAIALKFKAPLDLLTVLPASIDRIGQALIGAKNAITGVNLNFLEDELQGVVDAAVAQLEAVDPSTLVAELQAAFATIVSTIRSLYPAEAIRNLNDLYQKDILGKLGELAPENTIEKPLNAQFAKVTKLMTALDVQKLFAAIDSKLKSIEQELDEGLDREAAAFNQLLNALPSPSLDVSISSPF